jgi:4-amino-4-deoxy-L-arabinose transferase-like glycosyltransferase
MRNHMINCSIGWITGGVWIGLLVGVMTLGTMIFMLTPAYRTVVTIHRERDFSGEEKI